MIDVNRVVGIVVYCTTSTLKTAKEALVECVSKFIEHDLSQINGETCWGDGPAVGRIMNMTQPKSRAEFERCLKETVLDVCEIDTCAPKHIIIFSNKLSESEFILTQLYRQCAARRSELGFTIVDGMNSFTLTEDGVSDDGERDIKDFILRKIHGEQLSVQH